MHDPTRPMSTGCRHRFHLRTRLGAGACALALALAIALPPLCGPALAEEVLSPRILEEVARLAAKPEIDTNDPSQFESDAQYALRLKRLRQDPGITPYLMKLMRDAYAVRDGNAYGQYLFALSLRHDLKAADVDYITDEIRKIVAHPPTDEDRYKNRFIIWGVLTFGNYPSPEREELALALLQHQAVDDLWFRLHYNAAQALAKMGSLRAVPLIRQQAEIMKTKIAISLPEEVRRLAEFTAFPDEIEAKAKAKAKASNQ